MDNTPLAGEPLIPLSAVARLFPGHRGNKTLNPATAFRWVTAGATARDGRWVRLEAVRAGGRWLTSEAAVGRFLAALTADPPAPAAATARSPAARQRAADRAADQLRQMGA